MKYYMTPQVQVFIRVSGGVPLLLDEVCGIGYQADSSKIPVYAYNDINFSAVAVGRSIISGMLMVNKTFKDSIGTSLSSIIDASLPSSQVLVDDNIKVSKTGVLKDSLKVMKEMANLVDIYEAIIDDNIKGQGSLSYVNHWRVLDMDLASTNIVSYFKSSKDSYLNSIKNVIDTFENDYAKSRELLVAANGLRFAYFSGNTLLRPIVDAVNRADLKGSLSSRNSSGKVKAAIESIVKEITSELNPIATIPNEPDDIKAEVTRLIDYKLFNKLQSEGKKIELIIQFGAKEEGAKQHQLIVDECYFSGESVNVSVDDRRNIKEAYQFIAKQII